VPTELGILVALAVVFVAGAMFALRKLEIVGRREGR